VIVSEKRTAEAAAETAAKTTKTRARRCAGGGDATTAICTRTTAPWRAHSSRTSLRGVAGRQSRLEKKHAALATHAAWRVVRFEAVVQLVRRSEVVQHYHRRRLLLLRRRCSVHAGAELRGVPLRCRQLHGVARRSLVGSRQRQRRGAAATGGRRSACTAHEGSRHIRKQRSARRRRRASRHHRREASLRDIAGAETSAWRSFGSCLLSQIMP
jgi:hypothetical protein